MDTSQHRTDTDEPLTLANTKLPPKTDSELLNSCERLPTANIVRHRRWTQISTVAHRAILSRLDTTTERSENATSLCSTGLSTHYHAYRKYIECSYPLNRLSNRKPPNKEHIGERAIVPCREAVLFSGVFGGYCLDEAISQLTTIFIYHELLQNHCT